MIIVGLTGGIGMGKSTVAKMLRDFGFPVYSADKAVHSVLKMGGAAVEAVAKAFPDTLRRGGIDRKRLGLAVAGNPRKLRQLEKIVHPLIRKSERLFLQKARAAKAPAVVLEIPLLFETGAQKRCDVTLCVSAPRAVQKARVLARPGMDEKKFRAFLARQMPDAQKRKMADYVVPTGVSVANTKKALSALIGKMGLRKTAPLSSKRSRLAQGRSTSRKP
ncbi:MAG: dephospho-CoA kinase [Alphaproteobacteria bacterium]|nr:dephospho-CoA kinase [Alphaproteobacteria bacterium]